MAVVMCRSRRHTQVSHMAGRSPAQYHNSESERSVYIDTHSYLSLSLSVERPLYIDTDVYT